MKKQILIIAWFLCFQGCVSTTMTGMPTVDSMVEDGTLSQADVAAMRGDYAEMERLLEAEIGGDLASANYDQLFGRNHSRGIALITSRRSTKGQAVVA